MTGIHSHCYYNWYTWWTL